MPSERDISRLTNPVTKTAPTHLRYLDGLRGIAALFVVVHHAYAQVYNALPPVILRATHWLVYAQMAVDIFIVLSGYCLMLPVASTPDGNLRGGVWKFYLRRARRILPPYYAALAFSLLIIAFVPGMGQRTGVFWDTSLPAFTPLIIVSHLFMFYNFIPGIGGRIDYPMWTVAIEWSIYILFPIILLPIWRRLGISGLLGMALTIVVALHILQHHYHLLYVATPWFLFLFALGMTGAVIGFSTRPSLAALRQRLPWGGIAAVLWLVYWIIAQSHEKFLARHMWQTDIYVGIAAISLIIYCARWHNEPTARPRPLILKLLEARWAVMLGVFSYSLYLIHAPLLGMLHLFLRPYHIAPLPLLALHELIGVPCSLLFAYGFFLLFERPFLNTRRRETFTETAHDAALAPAP
jgi:peptidoglycan/LPS O-acetylase OafA/YrhL